MRISVELLFPFRRELPEGRIELELPPGADVEAAITALVDRFPTLKGRLYDAQGHLQRFVSALVNRTSVQSLQGYSTRLSDGDELTLLPPVGGG
ncbi:MoaD/ThiS family protein [Candidatus Bipolaricaulota bacterium]|nr:MoaD/ThiS family protein [Candidatus Bipolaricaulota bacterium]